MRFSKKYIWDYQIKKSDLRDPKILLWYLQRKIEYGDWSALDKKILKKNLPKLKINPYLKNLLRKFLKNE